MLFGIHTRNNKDLSITIQKLGPMADVGEKFVLQRTENIVGNGENIGYDNFLLFPQCFPKGFFFFFRVKIVLQRS